MKLLATSAIAAAVLAAGASAQTVSIGTNPQGSPMRPAPASPRWRSRTPG